MSTFARISVAAAMLMLALPSASNAQIARDSSVDWLVSAGSEGEQYLRVLQVAGLAPLTPWSIRPFSHAIVARLTPVDSVAPWAAQFRRRGNSSRWFHFTTAQVGGVFNSTRPYGINDGPMWAGRGVTVSGVAGASGAIGPLEFVVAPSIYAALNGGFPLEPNGYTTGPLRFANGRYPNKIDLPQRFGDHAYAEVDPGEGAIALRLFNLTLGASTASEAWGPALEEPFLLGGNAAGFPHLYAGTDGPVVIGPMIVGVRVIAGRLQQSRWSPAAPEDRDRSISGVIATLGLAQVPGLEIGAARVIENTYPQGGTSLGDILRPLWDGLLKANLRPGGETGNQLASAFMRWVFPESGVELYGELGREDHNYDLRDFLLEPDHDLAYSLGFQRVWKRPGPELLVLRGELLNSRESHLDRVREQEPPYIHAPVLQGHTQRGQVLGAPGGFGGGATMAALDWITPRGRRTVLWRRLQEEPSAGVARPVTSHAITAEWLLFRSRIDLKPEVTAVYTLNQLTSAGSLNARLALTGVAHW